MDDRCGTIVLMDKEDLKNKAIEALRANDQGGWTRPAPDLYPHQWLWDSCFVAMGLAHVDAKRAKKELLSLFRGQWSNGMIPHMIFEGNGSHQRPEFWDSRVSPYAPRKLATSGITQPPLIAEAVRKVGEQLSAPERRSFYKQVYPKLLAHHQWLYRERDPHATGLVLLIHPWETGMDNTPPWMEEMKQNQKPLWIKLTEALRLDSVIEHLRRDTAQVPANERVTTLESLLLYSIVRRLRRKQYDSQRILLRSHFLIEDVFFNSILVRANHHLKAIAKDINRTIPAATLSLMNKSSHALSELWDDETSQFYSREFIGHRQLRQPTIATFLPLYAGTISQERAEKLVRLLKDEHQFGLKYPVPTVPLSSRFFDERRYWQGPTWLNTNWMIIDGLRRYGFHEEAERIKQVSLELVDKSGFHEYFSPISGFGAGITPFSWTAALTIELLSEKSQKKS